MPPLLTVDRLHKRYGQHVALHKVSFKVDEGEFFGLLGPNGAGKSTLLSILGSLLPATSGFVTLAGRRLERTDLEARRWVGLVPQDLALYGELSARENLVFFGELFGVRGAELRTRVDEILSAVGLADRAEGRVDTFSGGMKRRLNLGVALVHRPRLLLLDEPTVGVDPQSRNHIFEEVRRLNAAGTTIVYTSHYMEEVQTLCRRVGIIDHGNLVACDTLTALLQRAPGAIRFQTASMTPELRARLDAWPGVKITEGERGFELTGPGDLNVLLEELLRVFHENRVPLQKLEMEPPNLERVFFDLTHTALRD